MMMPRVADSPLVIPPLPVEVISARFPSRDRQKDDDRGYEGAVVCYAEH